MASGGKNKLVAALLAFFLGVFGAHHLYLGSVATALVTFVVCVVTCGIGAILPFIEFILLLVMSEEEFDAKYNERDPQGIQFVFMKK